MTAVTPAVSCGPPDYFIQCYSPGEYQVAYGVAPLLRRGITGSGETVVMPELANAPGPNFTDIRKDLAAFDKKRGEFHRGRDRDDPRCHHPERSSGLNQREPR
jgi:hypothetical protein